jgi:hypothetical protein
MNRKQKIYSLWVNLVAGPVSAKYEKTEISRKILIKGNQSLSTLHSVIFRAFDRSEEHYYDFYIGKTPETREEVFFPVRKTEVDIYSCDPETEDSAMSVGKRIDSLKLKKGDIFLYLFDFGDFWLHTVYVESIDESSENGKYPKIVEVIGESPPQHREEDEQNGDIDLGEIDGEKLIEILAELGSVR